MSSVSVLLINMVFESLIRDFLESEVRVEVIGKAPRVITHEGFIELSRGAEYNIPRWIAYMLESKGIVRIKEDIIDVERLSTIAYNEEATANRPELMKVPKYLYLLVKNEVDKIKQKLKETADINLLQEYKMYEDLVYTITKTRIKKLLYLLLLSDVPQDLLMKMSEEEKALFIIMRDILWTWIKNLGVEKL